MTVSIGSVVFADRAEQQIDWANQYDWQGCGQSIRYALDGNIDITENARQGRPIILVATVPWSWILKGTLDALHDLASQSGVIHTLTYGSETFNVMFDRSQGPLQFEPVNALKQQYVGTIYLISV